MTDRLLATVRPRGATAAVRVEDVYATTSEDLWEALTDPVRLARWIADVSGDLSPGGAFSIRFTSSWEGSGRVDLCEPPHRLRVTTTEDGGGSTVIEAVLTSEAGGTRLVVEDRGLPVDEAPLHAAGWQVHLEDLGAEIAGRERSDWHARWTQLIPSYQADRPTDPGRSPA